MTGDLRQELERQARPLLGSFVDLAHRWEDYPGGRRLIFPRRQPDGFDVEIEAEAHALRVHGVGFHTHFDWQETAADAVRAALDLVRDLLSVSMRVRELRAADKPYRWEVQSRRDGDWITVEFTATLFWNYFAPRSERIHQNATLPPRN